MIHANSSSALAGRKHNRIDCCRTKYTRTGFQEFMSSMGEQTCQVSNETCSFSESFLRPSWLGVLCYGVYSRMCEPLMYYFILDLTYFVLMALALLIWRLSKISILFKAMAS